MAIVKRLSDYSLSGGLGGYHVEGTNLNPSQANAMSFSPMGGYSFASGRGGQPFMDASPTELNARREIDQSMNKMLGIQTAPGVIGTPSGLPGQQTVSTPGLAQKTAALQQSKEAKELRDEQREIERLKAIGETYNSMLKSATDPVALRALKESEDFKQIEKHMRDQLGRVFGSRDRSRYVTPKGDLRKIKEPGEVMYGEGGKKYTIEKYIFDENSGQPKIVVKGEDNKYYLADPDDLTEKNERTPSPAEKKRLQTSFIPLY